MGLFKAEKKGLRLYLETAALFVVLYFAAISFYNNLEDNRDQKNIAHHAHIVAYDVWTLNENNIAGYLSLAAETDGYKNLSVLSMEDGLALSEKSRSLDGLDVMLEDLGLISTLTLSADIYYEHRTLGKIYGERYNTRIYAYGNIAVLMLVIFIIGSAIIYLSNTRRILATEVKQRTKRYVELVNLLPEMVFETDASGMIVYANMRAHEQFNDQADLIFSLNCSELFEIEQDDESYSFFEVARSGRLAQTQCRAKRNDGTLFPVLVSSSPIYSGKEFEGVRLVVLDITERCALEEQLLRDKKMKSIGLMASGVAHDLNNILSGLINYPELIMLQYPGDQRIAQYVEPIRKSGEEAAAVVSDLLTVARGVVAEKLVADIHAIIDRYLQSSDFSRLQMRYPQMVLQVCRGENGKHIYCSMIHIRKCLMNLIANAAESMDGEGRVLLATESVSLDAQRAAQLNLEQGEYLLLSVKDNGPGIEKEHLEHIFEPFYSKKTMGRSGTGLGLSIVWNVLQDHGGTVTVKSVPGNTVFALYLPTTEQRPENIDVAAAGDDWERYHGNGENILVIDDDPLQRDIAEKLLTTLGYKVVCASSGEEAVELVKKQSFGLLLLDMVMTGGISGKETYRQVLQVVPEQKAIIISGFSASDDVAQTIEMGAGGLILKPYNKEKLAKIVHEELHK